MTARIGLGLSLLAWFLAFCVSTVWGAAGDPVPQLFVAADRCLACHNGLVTPSGQDVSIGSNWRSSIMAHSARDPYWQASVRRETLMHPKAAKDIQDECAACHMPMSRYQSNARGFKGQVFAHLPVPATGTPPDLLAADGVSCTLCHQIQAEKLGTEESFTAGFVVDTEDPLDERALFGPFDVDVGRTEVMRSAGRFVPTRGTHLQESALCGSCHTLYTHTLGAGGEVIGRLPEQVPFLEWRHGAYAETRGCQSCHMPQLDHPMAITSVLGQPREAFSRHVFRGANFFMLNLLNRFRRELEVTAPPQDLLDTLKDTSSFLQAEAARVSIKEAGVENGILRVIVEVSNLAGHKVPTAYPSRRMWLHFAVRDGNGRVVFESGGLRTDGSVAGNDNDADKERYERHYTVIDDENQVQIYEAVMETPGGRVTTGLLEAIRFVKDNRLLPDGFDKHTAGPDIAVRGEAARDPDFTGGKDLIRYSVSLAGTPGPLDLQVRVLFQPIGFRWAQNLLQQEAEEITRFASYYDSMSQESGIVLAGDSKTIPGP
jgi:hypothetical protein